MFKRTSTRLLQVSKTTNPSASLDQLNNLPTSTGAGLFVERPKFEPLGTPPTLLHISLPSSCVLNARTRSLVAANGDVSSISQKFGVINLWQKPLLYNELSSTKPLSLLLSNSRGFVNLELLPKETWTVMNTDDIAAWYGNLDISKSNVLNAGVQIIANDQSNLIITGKSQVFTIQLDQGESLNVSPGSLVAYTGDHVGFNKLKALELPTFGKLNTLKSWWDSGVKRLTELSSAKEVSSVSSSANEVSAEETKTELKGTEVVEVKEPSVVDTAKEWISTKLSTVFLKNRLFYEIQGPATLIIQNDSKSPSNTFTQKELTEIYKQLK